MKQTFTKWTFAAVTAAAMSLPFATGAYAETSGHSMLAASETMQKAEDAVSDTWITSKVKSTFLADKNLSGMDIKVETNQGVVALSGTVQSDAERDLAIDTAKSIKGVTAVSADGLKSAQ
ncbi:BON domain-containing protein [Metapseudomonas lalkuanensis]|uniref:Osmotically-inducible protein Y n=1 Tax=Metapseudomonas lalkuanensis TaxID=2604832 RepID=A0A5J6QUC8_9GAMM|nr:BON domain-containing protein [Pseudomonas lalkuanensis]QEY64921.1 BON domain-containing protein [Pseudomonas lalkuanensis]